MAIPLQRTRVTFTHSFELIPVFELKSLIDSEQDNRVAAWIKREEIRSRAVEIRAHALPTAVQRKYNAKFIDFGYCFNAGEWSFPDAPLRGVYGLNDVYERIESWDDFDPWLSRIERFPERQLRSIADEIPCEWYGESAEL